MAENPETFDPRAYENVARDSMKQLVRHKLRHVMGSAGKAKDALL